MYRITNASWGKYASSLPYLYKSNRKFHVYLSEKSPSQGSFIVFKAKSWQSGGWSIEFLLEKNHSREEMLIFKGAFVETNPLSMSLKFAMKNSVVGKTFREPKYES